MPLTTHNAKTTGAKARQAKDNALIALVFAGLLFAPWTMALSLRHRWCVGRLVEAFGPEVDEAQARAFIRQEEVHARFSALFRGGCLKLRLI